MGWFKWLSGKKERPSTVRDPVRTAVTQVMKPLPTAARADLPLQCFDLPPADNDEFVAKLAGSISAMYRKVSHQDPDPIMVLVAFDQERWRALLSLIYKQADQMLLSPEHYTKGKTKIASNGHCDVYVPPKVDGKTLRMGIYVVRRKFLFSQLCCVEGLPLPFISMVKDDKKADHFPIVVLNLNGMCVRQVPIQDSQQAEPAKKIPASASTKSGQDTEQFPGGKALLDAAQNGDANRVNDLIAAGVDVNYVHKEDEGVEDYKFLYDADNVTALITATYGSGFKFYENIGAYDAIVEALIAAGANVNAKDSEGRSALMYAAAKNKGSYQVKLLLEAGADVNARDNDGRTALMYAIIFVTEHNSETIEALKAAGGGLSPEDAEILRNLPPLVEESRYDIPRVSTPANALKAQLSDGMTIEEVHRMFGEPHLKCRYKLLGCDYHEQWITVDGRLRVFYGPGKEVEKWSIEPR